MCVCVCVDNCYLDGNSVSSFFSFSLPRYPLDDLYFYKRSPELRSGPFVSFP